MPREDGPEQSAQPNEPKRAAAPESATSPESAAARMAASAHARADAQTLPGTVEVSPLAVQPTELQGVRIGPYEVKGMLGSGGFGDVYLAEQHDPVHRLAAIKMLSPARSGAKFRALFEAERRVLAQIDHPNVARMLDAGSTPEGREWVAMEYAPGQPITAYCDLNRLSIEERMRLLSKVVRAVDFAHEKGLVHRDLKPGNILVSMDGGTPVPKIIDFGIARVLSGEALASEPNRLVGTPGYMAPEQTVGGGADADARADVYSLGAIMFELCTGTLPLADAAELAGGPMPAVETLAARAREREPMLMSARMTALAHARSNSPEALLASRVADNRRTSPRELVRALRGDLDWIVAKCLDRDRLRRYANAGELAEDLRQWRLNRPIEAAPRTVRYRARKFISRNRTTVALGTLLGVAVAAGLATSIVGWRTAIQERDFVASAEDRAAREATEARGAAAYISEVLSAASVDRSPDGSALTVVELLRRATQTADRELKQRPATEAVVRLALGKTYASLGLIDEAQVQLLRANSLADIAYGRQSAEMAETLEALASVSLLRGNPVGARALLEEARNTYTLQPGSNDTALARNSMQLAEVDLAQNQASLALEQLNTAERLARDAERVDPALLASIEWYRSLAFLALDRYDEALKAIERNLAENRSTLPADHWWIAESETVRAAALAGLGRAPEAMEIIRTAMPRLEKALQPGAPTLRRAMARAAFVADKAGAPAEAARYRTDSPQGSP